MKKIVYILRSALGLILLRIFEMLSAIDNFFARIYIEDSKRAQKKSDEKFQVYMMACLTGLIIIIISVIMHAIKRGS